MALINEDLTIGEVFKLWPQTAVLFNRYGMSCPGCYLNQFERLGTALRIYQVPVAQFMREINEIIEKSETSPRF